MTTEIIEIFRKLSEAEKSQVIAIAQAMVFCNTKQNGTNNQPSPDVPAVKA